MGVKPEARSWFERGIFDLAIAQAHLQSGIWDEAAKLARHAALKFLQAAVVTQGEPDPAPRIQALVSAAQARGVSVEAGPGWETLDKVVGDVQITQDEARLFFRYAEQIRDAVAKVL